MVFALSSALFLVSSPRAEAAVCNPGGIQICSGSSPLKCVLSPYGTETTGASIHLATNGQSGTYLFDGVDAHGNPFTCSGQVAGQITISGSELGDWIEGDSYQDPLVTSFIIWTMGGDDGVQLNFADGTAQAVVYAGAGDDWVLGTATYDILYGEEGADYLMGSGATDRIWGGPGPDTIYGDEDGDYLYGEGGDDFVAGGDGDDIIDGGGQADVLFGEEGNDTLTGNIGADTLCGGADDDTLDGQQDDDLVYGGTGVNTEAGGPGVDACTARNGTCESVWATATSTCGTL